MINIASIRGLYANKKPRFSAQKNGRNLNTPSWHTALNLTRPLRKPAISGWVATQLFLSFHPYLGKISSLTDIFQMG